MKNYLKILSLFFIVTILVTSCKKDDSGDNEINGNGTVIQSSMVLKPFTNLVVYSNFKVIVNKSDSAIYQIAFNAESNLIPYIDYEIVNNILTIKVDDGYKLNNTKPIVLTISSPENVDMSFYESSQLVMSDINCDNSYVISLLNSSTASLTNVTFSNLTLSISGSSILDGSGLELDKLTVKTYTSSRVELDNINVATCSLTSESSGDCILTGNCQAANFVTKSSGIIKAAEKTFNNNDLLTGTCKIDIEKTGYIYVNASTSLTGTINGSGNLYYRGDIVPSVKLNSTGEVFKL